jgi:hypothetical protein
MRKYMEANRMDISPGLLIGEVKRGPFPVSQIDRRLSVEASSGNSGCQDSFDGFRG